ncbi:MAG: YfiR family protein [Pirellulales bacterium]|nr:YfiR family protein [Pirellulales bacterium]
MSRMPKSTRSELVGAPGIARSDTGARALGLAAMLLAGMWWLPAARAQAPQSEPAALHKDYEVKAAYLYGFGRYIEWPENAFQKASDPFVIGVVGEDPIIGALEEISAKRKIQQRKIVVRRFAAADDFKQPCQILFVSHSIPPEEQAALIKKTRGLPLLAVGETPGFAENGGGANFISEGDRVQFEINIESARRSRLRMDAQLLKRGKPVGSQQAAATAQ